MKIRSIHSASPLFHFIFLITLSFLFWVGCTHNAFSAQTQTTLIEAQDVDGKKVKLNAKERIHVIIYSTQSLQAKTRAAGKSLYPLQGHPNLRVIVVIDLRSSLAQLAKGYTIKRARADLDEEAKRLEPFYRKNGNFSSPRPDLSAIADFDGALCRRLGWNEPSDTLQVIVYDNTGREIKRWKNLKDYDELYNRVKKLLSGI